MRLPWPALYFVDADGIIRDHHFGEGRYEQSERVIQRLLGIERELVSVEGLGVEAEADWDHLRTPETYLGYERSEHFASPDGAAFDERRAYELPERLRFNHWALAGEWTIGREKVVLDQAGGSIAYRFHARDAHLVLSPGAREPIPFRLRLSIEDRRAHEADLLALYHDHMIQWGVKNCDREELGQAYRLVSLYCLVYPMIAGAAVDIENPRALDLLRCAASRAWAAIEDHQAVDFLPH